MGLLILSACSVVPVESTKTINENSPSIEKTLVWRPSPGASFQIQFSGDLDLSIDADIFDLDAFDTDIAIIEQLHQGGKHVICYLNAGAVEDWRPDADLFPPKVIGKAYQGWPGENWLDIRNIEVLAPILETRLDLCKSKGFDGVEFDNVDGYQNDTGFNLTAEDQLSYNRWLADAAHERGLVVGLKNDPDQIVALEPWFDFLILESCFNQGWCEKAEPFVMAGKLVIDIEYIDIKPFCSQAKSLSISLIGKSLNLNANHYKCP